MMRRTLFILICFTLLPVALYAQEERKHVRRGNKIYEGGDYEKAQIEYQTAKELNNDSFEATFNLGDAFFKKEKYDEALKQFETLTEREDLTPEQAGAAWYNLGNSYMATQKLDEAIEAYKNSLRARPNSMEAKYNLEYAKSMKQDHQNQQNQDQQNQQNQNQNQNQDQNQNKDQDNQNQDNQDQQNQDQNQDRQNQNQQNQQNQNQNQDQNQNQNQNQNGEQQSESKISKEDAERLLEALSADEQDVRDKVQKEKMEEIKAKQMKIDKDW